MPSPCPAQPALWPASTLPQVERMAWSSFGAKSPSQALTTSTSASWHSVLTLLSMVACNALPSTSQANLSTLQAVMAQLWFIQSLECSCPALKCHLKILCHDRSCQPLTTSSHAPSISFRPSLSEWWWSSRKLMRSANVTLEMKSWGSSTPSKTNLSCFSKKMIKSLISNSSIETSLSSMSKRKLNLRSKEKICALTSAKRVRLQVWLCSCWRSVVSTVLGNRWRSSSRLASQSKSMVWKSKTIIIRFGTLQSARELPKSTDYFHSLCFNAR